MIEEWGRKGGNEWNKEINRKGIHNILWDFPGDSVVRNLPDNAGDASLIPGAGRSAGEGNSNPL